MNYYEILEVNPRASAEVIRAAYRSLMQRYHPDKNPGNAEFADKAAQIARAYEVLADPGKRALYDAELAQGLLRTAPVAGSEGGMRRPPVEIAASSVSKVSVALFVLFGIVIAWYLFSPSGKGKALAPEVELKAIRQSIEGKRLTLRELREKSDRINEILASNAELRSADVQERVQAISARTILSYTEKLSINIEVPNNPDEQRVLTIPTLGLVVGSFDSEKFMGHLEQNKDYLVNRIEARLAEARVGALEGPNGKDYLREYILNAFAEITGAKRDEEYPSTYTEAPGRYGVVDVLFPDSFRVEKRKTHSDSMF